MTKPVTIPNTFATATTAIPLSQLDSDFSTVATALNDANTYSNYAADTGVANAYVVTLSGVSTTYSAGLRIQFKAGAANTGASTLNVNGGGTKNITFQDASALSSGTIAANAIVDVMYDGTQFLLMNDPAGATGGDVVGPASATDNAIVRFDGATGKLVQNSVVTIADSTGDISGVGTLNATTLDATNIEVTNIKAKDGTAAASIADSTGVISVTANPVLSGGTANGVLYLNGSNVATSGSALTFDGSTFFGGVNTIVTGRFYAQRSSSSLNLPIAGYTDGSAGAVLTGAKGDIVAFGNAGGDGVIFANSNTEQMRLTSTGLGIGTSSPVSKFAVEDQARFEVAGVSTSVIATQALNAARSATAEQRIYGLAVSVYTGAAGSQAMAGTFDSSGNLGLGVTPSAWNTGKALEINAVGFGLWGAFGNTYLNANYYYNAADKFAGTGYALQYLQVPSTGAHIWKTSIASGTAGNAITFTQAMTLDASGNLLVGTTSQSWGTSGRGLIEVNGSSSFWYGGKVNETQTGYLAGTSSVVEVATVANIPLAFLTNNTERARITSGGYFKASDSGTYDDVNGAFHEFYSTANNSALYIRATNASYASNALGISVSRNTTDNTFYALSYYNSGAAAYKFRVADSGNVTNTNGTYGTISDAKMKTDIVDAGSQWADIKAIRFRKFKMKDDPSGLLQLGVVAQELEQTSPGLVDEHVDRDAEGNDLGTTTKSVKTSILLMKAAKALQEAMARIETLEAKVSALEGN